MSQNVIILYVSKLNWLCLSFIIVHTIFRLIQLNVNISNFYVVFNWHWCVGFAYTLMWKVPKKSGALSITCSNSMNDNFPSPSTSASSMTFSHTWTISSADNWLRVNSFSTCSRSVGPMWWSSSKSTDAVKNYILWYENH